MLILPEIFAVNSISQMFGLVYWQNAQNRGVMPSNILTTMKVSVSVGTVIGQVVFGHLADRIGRRQMYGIELVIMILTTTAQAIIGTSGAINVTAVIVFWRIFLGIGIGGDYALSAVITAE